MNTKNMKPLMDDIAWLRDEIIGRNMPFKTPFGNVPLVYADFTASGRGLFCIENYIQKILQFYANTHTEDDFTGKTMTTLLHEAEHVIKHAVNAGEKGKIIFTESGTTGGITKLQQILGVYWAPATRERIQTYLKSCLDRNENRELCNLALHDYIENSKPIVFVGPYEHHSNELMWRETLCEIVEVPLSKDSELDLVALEQMVSDPKYATRQKIGSFSAASNVSGLITDVYEVARILHKYGAIACFDFAACAPYLEINMNKDAQSYFDAIFLSPHKFLGGPGTSGILVFNEDIYQHKLPPTVAAGGTVEYVSPLKQEFVKDIETREKPGTPGIIQAIRVAMVFLVKEKVGLATIDTLERHFYRRFMQVFEQDERINFYGPLQEDKKIPIIPFNIVHKDKYLHPKFVTRLFNDLFGIQTRAGCSCAGPYGHYLMKIDPRLSDFYRCVITNAGYAGIKPGWVRLNLHYIMDNDEVDYLINALKFICEYGYRFIPLYVFNIKNGEWNHRDGFEVPSISLSLDDAVLEGSFCHKQPSNAPLMYKSTLQKAYKLVESLSDDFSVQVFEPELEKLMFFYVHKAVNHHFKK